MDQELPGWQYPAVIDTQSGVVRYDNYEGHWGDQQHLDRFLQLYAVEKAKLEARKKEHSGALGMESPLGLARIAGQGRIALGQRCRECRRCGTMGALSKALRCSLEANSSDGDKEDVNAGVAQW